MWYNVINATFLRLYMMNRDKQNKVISDLMADYNELVDQIFRFVYFKVSSKELAQDLTQDSFLSVLEYLQKEGREEIKNIRAFVYRTARNKVIDYYRKKGRVIYSDEAVLAEEKKFTKDDIAIKQDAKMLIEKLNLLGDDDKEILIMRYVEDLDIKEIASIVGKSQVAARVQIFRATQRFKKIVNRK